MTVRRAAARHRWCLVMWSALTLTAYACSNVVPLVPQGKHPESGGVWPLPVDSRPPAPQVQVVSERPHSSCMWLDGEWVWQRNAWTWRDGGWVLAIPGCYYARSALTWQGGPGTSGVLYYTPGQWYRRATLERCSPPVACTP